MSLLDALAGEVEAALGQVRSSLDAVVRFGGVADLAGDPTKLRRAAQAWRQAASDLRYVEHGVAAAAGHTPSFWQEGSADAFAGQWARAASKIEALASDLERGAQSLDVTAGQLDREAALLWAAVTDLERLAALLSGAADPIILMAAVQQAPALLGQLQDILRRVEAALATLIADLSALELAFLHVMGEVAIQVPLDVARVGEWGSGTLVTTGESVAGAIRGGADYVWEGVRDHVGEAIGLATGGAWPLLADLLPRAIAYALGFRVVERVVGNKVYYIAMGTRILDGSLLGRWIMTGRLPGTRYVAGGRAITGLLEDLRPARMLTSLVDLSPEGVRLLAKGAGPFAIVLVALPDVYDYSPIGSKAKLGYHADFWADVLLDESSTGAALGVGALAGAGAGAAAGAVGGSAAGPEGAPVGAVAGGIVGTGAAITAGTTYQVYMMANPAKHQMLHNYVRDHIILHPGDTVGTVRSWVVSHLPKPAAPNVSPHPMPGPHPPPG
jgi:hypothetical protein